MIEKSAVVLLALALLSGCGSMPAAADYCAEYRATMQGRSPEEKRRAAEAHVARMHGQADPAHVERHLQMIERRCGN